MFSTLKKFLKKRPTKKPKTNLNNSKSKLLVKPYLGEHYERKADSIHLSHLNLSSDTMAILMKSELYYLSDILQFSSLDLIRVPYIKTYHIDELIECLAEMGLGLKSDLWSNPPALYEKTVFGHLIDDWSIYDEYQKRIMPIVLLDFSIRTYNCLKRANIHRVGEILDKFNDGQIKSACNMGVKSMDEIETKLNAIGIRLPSDNQKKVTGHAYYDICDDDDDLYL